MKKLLFFFILPVFLNSFKNGEGTAKLTCRSQSGRTVFEAEFGEYTILRQAKLTIDGDSTLFYYSDNCTIIFDARAKVYTLNIESIANGNFDTARFVQLWAIPSTFIEESASGTGFRDLYRFTAKFKARDPRKGKDYETPLILLDCTLRYANP
jgi:hypothetical protein